MEGILIAIEGIDGVGKTTQVRLLGEALERAGEPVVVSKEPTDGKWGQRIRESAKNGRMTLEEEIEAFRNDRIEHVDTVIRPALEAGKTVVLDRYFYSFIAYQGARGANPDQLREASGFAPVPDTAILLDVDPRISLARIEELRGDDPNHFETVAQLDDVRLVFLDVFDGLENGLKIDGARSIPEVQQTIADQLLSGVLKKKRCAKVYGCDDPIHCIPRIEGRCEWYNLLAIKPKPEESPALIPEQLSP